MKFEEQFPSLKGKSFMDDYWVAYHKDDIEKYLLDKQNVIKEINNMWFPSGISDDMKRIIKESLLKKLGLSG